MSAPVAAAVDVPADVQRTFEVLTSAEWPAALDADLNDGSRLVSAEATPDGGMVVAVSRRLPEGTPPMLRSFLPADGRVTQTDTWLPACDGVRTGTWQVSFPGSPGDIRGTTRVEPAAAGSRWVVDGLLTIKVPIVGGKAEGFLAPLLEKLFARQGEVLAGHLVKG